METLRKYIKYYFLIGCRKSKDDRYVPICDELILLITSLKKEYKKNNMTNNHALRMSFNSLILIPSGFTPTERAAILGQSELVNINNYSFDKLNSTKEKALKMCSYGHN